ncbi:unnamed protein product [Paramecium primaurelia]|uniref:Palmitoyltransferase n=1 Tax=Paramecium primaurelia TaxID=5886 RepID=A0A8S1KGF2_PARPR|nr:unnamed protein product [Paramecium primaurelia]
MQKLKYKVSKVSKYLYQIWQTQNKIFCIWKQFTGSENYKLLASANFITIPSFLFYLLMSPESAKTGQNGSTVVFVLIQITIYFFLFGLHFVWILELYQRQQEFWKQKRLEYEMNDELLDVPQKYSKIDYRFIMDSKNVYNKSSLIQIKVFFNLQAINIQLSAIYRSVRVSHCPSCDNCVVRFDHHCSWIGQCTGRRNYIYFYFFLLSFSFKPIFVFGVCLSYIVDESKKRSVSKETQDAISETLANYPISIILVIYSFGVILKLYFCFVIGLWGFHTYLVLTDMRTNEYLKKYWTVKSNNQFRRFLINLLRDKIFLITFQQLKQYVYEPKEYIQSHIHTQNHLNEVNDSQKYREEDKIQVEYRGNQMQQQDIQIITEIKP